MKTSRRRNGEGARFTLVELLVVVAILAVLLSLLLPALSSARELGKGARCASNLRQIGIQQQSYIDDYGTYCFAVQYASPWRAWVKDLGPYFSSVKAANSVFCCPSGSYSWSPYSASYSYNGNLSETRPSLLLSPSRFLHFIEGDLIYQTLTSQSDLDKYIAYRHNAAASLLLADNHVESVKTPMILSQYKTGRGSSW